MDLTCSFRRGVVTLSSKQLDSIYSASVTDKIPQVPCLKIDDNLSSNLWVYGVFYRINEICGSFIGDYEEEELSPSQLLPAMRAAEFFTTSSDPNVSAFARELVEHLRQALNEGSSVHFVL